MVVQNACWNVRLVSLSWLRLSHLASRTFFDSYLPMPIDHQLTNTLLTYSFNSSYYGKDYRAGAALLRARRPYLLKNAVTGLSLCGICVGVCTCALSQPSLSPVP